MDPVRQKSANHSDQVHSFFIHSFIHSFIHPIPFHTIPFHSIPFLSRNLFLSVHYSLKASVCAFLGDTMSPFDDDGQVAVQMGRQVPVWQSWLAWGRVWSEEHGAYYYYKTIVSPLDPKTRYLLEGSATWSAPSCKHVIAWAPVRRDDGRTRQWVSVLPLSTCGNAAKRCRSSFAPRCHPPPMMRCDPSGRDVILRGVDYDDGREVRSDSEVCMTESVRRAYPLP